MRLSLISLAWQERGHDLKIIAGLSALTTLNSLFPRGPQSQPGLLKGSLPLWYSVIPSGPGPPEKPFKDWPVFSVSTVNHVLMFHV